MGHGASMLIRCKKPYIVKRVLEIFNAYQKLVQSDETLKKSDLMKIDSNQLVNLYSKYNRKYEEAVEKRKTSKGGKR